ncbi:MAG: hypothetical protein AAB408_00045, partial [Patescibacteria group bacterium]
MTDGTERLKIVWFNQPFLTKTLQVGDRVFFSGKVKSDMLGVSLVSPMYEKEILASTLVETLPQPSPTRGGSTFKNNTIHTGRLVPIYPLTFGITQKQIRFLLSQVIGLATNMPDWVPSDLLKKAGLLPLPKAIAWIHFPNTDEERQRAEKRLKFDELFLLQLRAEMLRQSLARSIAPVISFREAETKNFVSHLPFTLTKDQKIAAWEILQDIQSYRTDFASAQSVTPDNEVNNIRSNEMIRPEVENF